MLRLFDSFEASLQNRKTMIATLVGSLLLLLVAYNIAGWVFIRRFQENLDDELGKRLQSVSSLVARLVERELPQDQIVLRIPEITKILLRQSFEENRRENELQAIYLINGSYQAILSSPGGSFAPGEVIRYLQDDSAQVRAALAGEPAASRLHDVLGNKFKSGYAPVRNFAGDVIAVVVAEGAANFFIILDKFQNGLIVGIIISLLLVAIYGVFISWTVTSYVKLQDQIRRNERLASMGQMAATVAHEIRNPLGIIKNTAEVLRELAQPDAKQTELFDFIPAEVDRLNRLVNDFLTFARDKELKLSPRNLIETIGTAVSHIKQEAKGSEIQIDYCPEVDQLSVAHNPDSIRQVILNLVMNAMEAMNSRGRIKIEVKPVTKWGRRFASVSVLDNGPGLGENPERVFEPFFTTKTSGSGLGLAVTKQIIDKHNGSIEAKQAEGGGAHIQFSLPLTSDQRVHPEESAQ